MATPLALAPVGDLNSHRVSAPSRFARQMDAASGCSYTAGVATDIGRAGSTVGNSLVGAPAPRPEVPPSVQASELAPLAIRINEVHTIAPWGRSTTYALVKSGRLRAKKLGRCTFVLLADLWALIDELEDVVPRE